jgi:hypothetical protein
MSIIETSGYSGSVEFPIKLSVGSLNQEDWNDFMVARKKVPDLGVGIIFRKIDAPLVFFADGGNHAAKKDAMCKGIDRDKITDFQEGQIGFDKKTGRVKELFLNNLWGMRDEIKISRSKLIFDAICPELMPLENAEINFGNSEEAFYIASSKEILIA